MPRKLLLALACSLAVAAAAQPTWRFPIAFEDGAGARDTIWMVYDTTATLGSNPWPGPNVDTLLGEGQVNVDDGLFHVFLTNAVGDTTQTNAYPYSVFPSFEGTIIDGMNWTPPMTITWDTSLFHASYLPYGQGNFGVAFMEGLAFSGYPNNPNLQFGQYDMLISDSITVDFLSDYLFQFGILFGADDGVGIRMKSANDSVLSFWPNPAQTVLNIQTASKLDLIQIMDLSGRIVRSITVTKNNGSVDIASLSSGTYILLARSPQNQIYHGKFQKVD